MHYKVGLERKYWVTRSLVSTYIVISKIVKFQLLLLSQVTAYPLLPRPHQVCTITGRVISKRK